MVRSMTSTWAASLAHNYESAVESMRAVLQDCPDELWAANMWEVRKTDLAVLPPRGADGEVPEDPVVQERMLQAFSAVWSVAYHALFHLDYDLGGGIEPWSPPRPFGKDDQGAFVVPRTYTRDELLTYTDYCVTGRAESSTASPTSRQQRRSRTTIDTRGSPTPSSSSLRSCISTSTPRRCDSSLRADSHRAPDDHCATGPVGFVIGLRCEQR